MREWRKTLRGKIVCYLVCVICAALTVVSIISSIFMYDFGFYVKSLDNVQHDIREMWIHGDGYKIVREEIVKDTYSDAETKTDRTNLRYAIFDANGKALGSNLKEPFKENSNRWEYTLYYQIQDVDGQSEIYQILEDQKAGKKNVYKATFYIAQNTGVKDKYHVAQNLIDTLYGLRYGVVIIGIVACFGALAAFINLMCVAGRKPESDKIYEGPMKSIPTDLLIVIYVGIFLSAAYLAIDAFYTGELVMNIALIVIGVMAFLVGLWMLMEIAVRFKSGSLFKNTIVYRAIKAIGRAIVEVFKIIKKLPLVWKTVLGLVIYLIADLAFMLVNCCYFEYAVVLWVCKSAFVVPIVIYFSFALRKLKLAGKELSDGNLLYKVDTSKLILDLKEHGENLNSIASGMSKAVEDRMKSERMKTELITNVSHDIKNPLTSIISYADLISKEECSSEKHKEYSEVLVKKSIHLKRLLEDLVEISKAETGNLDIELTQCNGNVLLSQLTGEFEERCQKAGLTLVVNGCEGPVDFMGDGRRIWRIFENMMSNICKYSMNGSRVYLDMTRENGNVIFTFKNTSREPLNISVDELMERFVRGDESRNTEGNGLGLSIADSLMKLQNGKMSIFIDGDLFKVTLKFKGV